MEEAERLRGIGLAAASVRAGNLVVFPTDTVYGIGADAFNNAAVAEILKAKHRGPDYPVAVLVGSWNTIQGLVSSYNSQMKLLVEAFWPGGLSLVVPQAPSLPWNLGDTRGTVMLRMPNHPIALQLLREVGPMAVSSANIHGHPPAIRVTEAQHQLGEAVDIYLDGGDAVIGQPSTIVDLSSGDPRILREGATSAAEIARVLDISPESLLAER